MDPDSLAALTSLTDPKRLPLLGLLAGRPMTAAALTEALALPLPTVDRQLRRLEAVGLVEVRPGGVHALRVDRLQEIARAVDHLGPPPGESPGGGSLEESRILRSYVTDGRLTTIPAQQSKRLVILRWLARTIFDEPRPYPEKELNQRIALIHPDVASLRRYLVDHGFAKRARGIYELNPPETWPS